MNDVRRTSVTGKATTSLTEWDLETSVEAVVITRTVMKAGITDAAWGHRAGDEPEGRGVVVRSSCLDLGPIRLPLLLDSTICSTLLFASTDDVPPVGRRPR